MTPSHHRVHHAQNERYIDRNYGGMFIAWDRLFGTFEPENDEEPVIFGVRKPLANWNPFWANLQVYDYLLFDARKARHWRDKLGIWFRRTGWRPPDVELMHPKSNVDLANFRKFDPPVPAMIKRYTLFQFAFAIVAVLWIGELYLESGARAVIIPCIAVWLLLLSLGLLNEGRERARWFELLRLLVVVPALLLALHVTGGGVPQLGWLAGGVYVLASSAWLLLSQAQQLAVLKQ